jgi:hypothetical protein
MFYLNTFWIHIAQGIRENLDCKLFQQNRKVDVKNAIPDKANGLPFGVDCDIYLYSGPPDVRPNCVKMVELTCQTGI